MEVKPPSLPEGAVIATRIIQATPSIMLFMDTGLNLMLTGFIIKKPTAQANAAPIAANSPNPILALQNSIFPRYDYSRH